MATTVEELDVELTHNPDAPDSALDLIHMMEPSDWEELGRLVTLRPARWRAACAYVLGEGPPEGFPLLHRLQGDEDPEVAAEAADSLQALAAGD